jgi:GNAT superfamily N-acetyltransferase
MTADYAQAIRNRQAWAAVQDGGIADFAIIIARPGYLLLDNVAVLPAAQDRGIRARLLALAEDHARGLGLSEIRLYTSEAMTRTSPITLGTGIRRPTGPSNTAFAGCSSVNPSTGHPTRGTHKGHHCQEGVRIWPGGYVLPSGLG